MYMNRCQYQHMAWYSMSIHATKVALVPKVKFIKLHCATHCVPAVRSQVPILFNTRWYKISLIAEVLIPYRLEVLPLLILSI